MERREQFALSCGTPAFVLTEGTPPWTTTGIQDLIGAIYEAPLEPQQWTYVVSRLKSETRSRLGHLFAGTVHDTLEDFTSPDRYLGYDSDTLPLADLESFGRHMRDSTINDPRRLRFSPALHAKKAFFSWEVMPLDEFKRSAFYNEFGQGMDSFGGLIAATTGRGGNFIHLAFHRSESDPLFDENDKRLLSVFLPHIWRSLDVHQRLLTANTQSSLLRNSFDALQSAIVLLKQDGKVIFLNRAAEELIERCAELYLCRDRLCAVNHADHLKLDRLIKTVTGGAGRQRLGEGMTIRRETGHSLQIISAPVPTDSQATLMAGLGPVAMLVIHDPDQRTHVSQETIAAMFGLTPSEARLLLALAQGETLAQYAKESHVTRNTAHTPQSPFCQDQYLKAVGPRPIDARHLALRSLVSLTT